MKYICNRDIFPRFSKKLKENHLRKFSKNSKSIFLHCHTQSFSSQRNCRFLSPRTLDFYIFWSHRALRCADSEARTCIGRRRIHQGGSRQGNDRTRIDSARLGKFSYRLKWLHTQQSADSRLRKLTARALITKMGPSFRVPFRSRPLSRLFSGTARPPSSYCSRHRSGILPRQSFINQFSSQNYVHIGRLMDDEVKIRLICRSKTALFAIVGNYILTSLFCRLLHGKNFK